MAALTGSTRPIMDSILGESMSFDDCGAFLTSSCADGIGNTPMVRLDRIAKDHGLKCNLRK